MYNTNEANFIEMFITSVDIVSNTYSMTMDEETGRIKKKEVFNQKVTQYRIRCNYCNQDIHPAAVKPHVRQHIKGLNG